MASLRLPTPQEHAEMLSALGSLRQALPLNAAQIQQFVERASILEVRRGEVTMSQGDPPDYLYFVLSGQLRASDTIPLRIQGTTAPLSPRRAQGGKQGTTARIQPRTLNHQVTHAFVGEYGMLRNEPRTATVDAISDARLAVWNQDDFAWLMDLNDEVRTYFEAVYRQHVTRSDRSFPGKQWDEVVVYNGGKHLLQLLSALIGPVFLLVASACLVVGLSWVETPAALVEIVAGLPAAIGLAWAAFGYFDWRNDEYIVTSKRVIRIERLLLYGEQWDEAPLVRVQDVTVVAHNWLQQAFDYSDLCIKTAGVGRIVFAGVRQADRVRELIFQEQAQARDRRVADDKSHIRAALAHRIGPLAPPCEAPKGIGTGRGLSKTGDYRKAIPDYRMAAADASVQPSARFGEAEPHRLPRLIDYLYPRLTVVEGESIAWRKHWIVLLRKVMPPIFLLGTTVALAVLALGAQVDREYATVAATAAILAMAVALFWYILRYDDWHRDVYIVTGNRIIDVESSALRLRGESRREGTFDAVQNVTYSIPNFLSRLLNLGDVVIETAGTERTFTFNSVFNPSAVQQEIFNRWDAHSEERRRRETENEAQRLAEWIGEYHELQQPPCPRGGRKVPEAGNRGLPQFAAALKCDDSIGHEMLYR